MLKSERYRLRNLFIIIIIPFPIQSVLHRFPVLPDQEMQILILVTKSYQNTGVTTLN